MIKRKSLNSLTWLVLLFGLCFAQPSLAAQVTPYVLNNFTLIDVKEKVERHNISLVIVGDRIATVGKTGTIQIPRNARIINAKGKFLMPGLWDMHTHTLGDWFFPLYLANGITGVRDMGNYAQTELELRKNCLKTGSLCPRIYSAGPILDGVNPIWDFSIPVSNAEDGRKGVQTIKRDFDFVKVYSLLTREAYFAIADEAKKQNITFVGHVPVSVTAWEASDAGQKSIEHLDGIFLSCSRDEELFSKQAFEVMKHPQNKTALLSFRSAAAKSSIESYDPGKAAKLFARFAQNGTWQVPTLIVQRALANLDDPNISKDFRLKYLPIWLRQQWSLKNDPRFKSHTEDEHILFKIADQKRLAIVRDLFRSKVPLLAGTDTPNPYVFPGFSLHDELALFVEAGLTPLEAIQTATINPARYFGIDKEFGSIEKGKFADMILLDSNPLTDIHNTRKISEVIINGKLLNRSDLQDLLFKIETKMNSNN